MHRLRTAIGRMPGLARFLSFQTTTVGDMMTGASDSPVGGKRSAGEMVSNASGANTVGSANAAVDSAVSGASSGATTSSSSSSAGPPAKESPLGPMPKIPAKIDKSALFDAAGNYALKDDWSCMKGPPTMNPALPGLRYGASIEIRPQLVVLPCPCAGGVRSKPIVDDGGVLGSSGLWASWKMPPGAADSAIVSSSAPSKEQAKAATTNFTSSIAGNAMETLGLSPPYYSGSEPYAADYGCFRGVHKRGLSSKLLAGSRLWDTPRWATVVVPTPCPCALGAYTGLQGPENKLETPMPSMKDSPVNSTLENPPADTGVGDDLQTDITIPNFVETPSWQQDSSMMMGDVGPAAPLIASLMAHWRARHEEAMRKCAVACFL